MQKTISILGSTGSVGKSVVDVIKEYGEQHFKVLALVANQNYQELAKQAIELHAKFIAIADERYFKDLKDLLSGHNIHVAAGESGVKEACTLNSDAVVAAMSGVSGLMPLYHAISNSSDIILANKESMVCAGRLINEHARKHKVNIIPIDSEHNALFQVFDDTNRDAIDSLVITCSGGPFRGHTTAQLRSVDAARALKHPKWSMGKKISIDSATLFNKGLEIIEAHYLFDFPIDKIKAVIHPESIIHGLVQYKDGSLLAQLGPPNMRVPIFHALYWPKRYGGAKRFKPLNLCEVGKMTFNEIDHAVFPSINLCRDAFKAGEQSLIALNASNEVAVEYFLQGKIKFLDIFKVVREMVGMSAHDEVSSIEEVMGLDEYFMEKTKEYIG